MAALVPYTTLFRSQVAGQVVGGFDVAVPLVFVGHGALLPAVGLLLVDVDTLTTFSKCVNSTKQGLRPLVRWRPRPRVQERRHIYVVNRENTLTLELDVCVRSGRKPENGPPQVQPSGEPK